LHSSCSPNHHWRHARGRKDRFGRWVIIKMRKKVLANMQVEGGEDRYIPLSVFLVALVWRMYTRKHRHTP
jgi:hypothetical protein